MTEIISQFITETLGDFDFSFCIAVNIATYLLIKLLDTVNKDKQVTTWQKRVILCNVIIVIAFAYYYSNIPTKKIINSAILAPVFWSWICKPLCKHFNIDYRKDIDILE